MSRIQNATGETQGHGKLCDREAVICRSCTEFQRPDFITRSTHHEEHVIEQRGWRFNASLIAGLLGPLGSRF